MKAIVTVVGPDRIGIIAEVCTLLAGKNINILDISQTIMEGTFTMMMLTALEKSSETFEEVATALEQKGEQMSLSIRIQREDIFKAMHRV